LITVAGYLFALIAALGVAVIAEILDGRITQRWQVERILELPVLSELRLKP
jgi:capsular polysaccharide biosynthesis protein